MKVIQIEEQPDGSALVTVDMSEEEKDTCIEIGFLTMLKEGMKAHEDNFRTSVPE
jgi:hypothetical protein